MPRRLTAAQHDRIQAEHRARFDTETALLLPAVRAALGTYLAALNRRVDQSAFGLAAPAPVLVAAGPIAQPAGPDPHQFTTGHAEQLQAVFDHAAPEWSAALQSSLVPGIKAMLGRIPLPADHPDVITAAESWRSEWLAQRTQELVGVPDTITASIRAELDHMATEQGTSVFDAKLAVKDMLSPERLDWEAQRIARTECLPGDAVVTAANAHTLYRRWYSGQWVEIETDSGRKLSGTPNHPMLTARGWVGLGQLAEGDSLICHGANVEGAGSAGDVDVEHPPAPIAEVFEAASAVVIGQRAQTGQPDFHGDGLDGYVDVLAPDRVLRVGNFTPVEQGGCEKVLPPADLAAVLFAAASAPFGSRLTVDERSCLSRAANGYAGLLHDARHHATGHAVLSGQTVGGLASGVPGGDIGSGEVEPCAGRTEATTVLSGGRCGAGPGHTALVDEPLDDADWDAGGLAGEAKAGTAQVHVEHVRLINVTTFSGHVYNLSTTDGYFAINGAYTGNTVSANNQGMLASWRALIGAMGGGAAARKTWIGGQRPTHSAVSGTTIGIDEKFHVGNAEMDGPGDTAGGPGETVNCTCSLSFEIDDAPTTTDTAAGDAGAAEEGAAAGEGDAAAGEGEHTADGEHADAGGLFGPSFDFGAQTDDALAGMLSDAGASGDEASMNRILDELDRRDAAATADAEPGGTLSAEDVAKNARYEQLVREGADPEHAFADAYGVGQEKDVIKTAIGHLKSLGYKGRGWEQLTQSVFKEEAERMYQLAQSLNETKGFMLTKEAAAKGIDPRSLFTGPESRARKYASDELRQFWQKYTRITIEDVRAGILGGTLRAAGTAAWL